MYVGYEAELIGKLSTNHFSFNNLHTVIFLYNRTKNKG